jgi:chromosome segregation ATPase
VVTDGRDPSIEAELRLQIMQLRDHAIGAAASIGELRTQLAETQAQLEQKSARLTRLRKDFEAHDARLRATATWKIGRFVMLPVRVLRRLFR